MHVISAVNVNDAYRMGLKFLAQIGEQIGGIVDVYQRKAGNKAVLFDDIPGYAKGHRVLANFLVSVPRINLTLGLLTPPVGTALYVAARVTGATPAEILRPLMPFLVATLLILILLCWQPYLVTMFLD